MLDLADCRPSDIFYDLGCGDASVLIFAVKEFGVREAIGFENDPRRKAKAKEHIAREGLSDRISIKGDMKKADLSHADIILKMHFEDENDYDELINGGIRRGTRLIKHDLPLLGFEFYDVDYPFYLMKFPLKKMRTPLEWAARVMERDVISVKELWHELYYYGYEKGYTKLDIKRFDKILRHRLKGR